MKKNSKKQNKVLIPTVDDCINDDLTNDFDLTPEKKPALSTVRQQIKNTEYLMKEINDLKEKQLMPDFDRIKMYVDLGKYDKKINFKLGDMEKTKYPHLSPTKRNRHVKKLIEKNIIAVSPDKYNEETEDEEIFDDKEFEADEEVIDYSKRKRNYPNCAISYKKYRETVGINNIYIQNDILVIDITGKFMAEYEFLGLINRANIRECLLKIQKLNLFSFDIEKFLQVACCYSVDVTLDVLLPCKMQLKRMINAISSFSPIISNKYVIRKYKQKGLLITSKSKKSGIAASIYLKKEDLRKSVIIEDRRVKYTETIGEAGEHIAEHTLRLEVHLSKMVSTREMLKIPEKEKGVVLLKDVLNSHEPIFINVIKNSGVDLDKLYDSLTWYEIKADFFDCNKSLTDKDFTELVLAEWTANLLSQNDYKMDVVKAHLISEYNIDIESNFAQNLITKAKTNLYNYLCFRKPKTISAIILLIEIITDKYLNEPVYSDIP